MGECSTGAGNTRILADQDGLGVGERWFDRVVLVEAAGTVDAMTSPRLAEAITTAAAQSPHAVIVDLSKVNFLAAAGMSVLVVAHADIAPRARFGVVADGPATSRLLTLLGVDEVISMYRTVQAALHAVGSAQILTERDTLDASPLGHG